MKAHECKRQSGNVLDVVPEGTPTEVVEHRLPENELTCSPVAARWLRSAKEVRRTLQMKPAEFWVREDVYYTYACKNCEQETGEANIVKAAKRTCAAAWQLCLCGGSGLSGNAKIRHVLAAVPVAAGV